MDSLDQLSRPEPPAENQAAAERVLEAPPEALPQPVSRGAGWGTALRELAETILLTLVIFFVIRFAVDNYRIEGYSMEPNFHDGQFLMVNKLIYMLHPPERGDVVVFHFPGNLKKNYIKRIIGLPGEKVQISQGKVYVNDVQLDENYPLNEASYDWGPRVIDPEEFFVLGDNRPESSDSHAWGLLPAKDLIGKAWISYWPPQEWGLVNHYSYAAQIPATPNSPEPLLPTPLPSGKIYP